MVAPAERDRERFLGSMRAWAVGLASIQTRPLAIRALTYYVREMPGVVRARATTTAAAVALVRQIFDRLNQLGAAAVAGDLTAANAAVDELTALGYADPRQELGL